MNSVAHQTSNTNASPNDSVISCQGLTKVYLDGTQQIKVLDELNMSVSRGERIAIIGASGSGKSTLLHLLGGLDKPTSGTVTLIGQPFAKLSVKRLGILRNQSLGFIYQFHHLLPEFTALENVAMALLIRGESVDTARAQAAELLEKVGLGERLDHKPSALSGGERQRAAIARALITRPACVLADEPTGNLDRRTAESVYTLMLELNQALGISLVCATHDETLANKMDRVLTLIDGQLLAQG